MIAIPIDMPECCADCPCEHDTACYAYGVRDCRRYDLTRRPADCPLIDMSRYEDDGK